jgi:hypothetical protein
VVRFPGRAFPHRWRRQKPLSDSRRSLAGHLGSSDHRPRGALIRNLVKQAVGYLGYTGRVPLTAFEAAMTHSRHIAARPQLRIKGYSGRQITFFALHLVSR